MASKKIIAFDMYNTCLSIQGVGKLFPLISDILKVNRKELTDILLTNNLPLSEVIQKIGIHNIDPNLIKPYQAKEKEVLSTVQPFPETLQTLQILKKRYNIAIISNVSKEFIQPIKDYFPNIFDYKILSCEEGIKKPQKEIFELLIKRSGYKADEIIMVGDSMKSDVIGAMEAGIDAVLIDRSNQGIEKRDGYTKISSLDQIVELLK